MAESEEEYEKTWVLPRRAAPVSPVQADEGREQNAGEETDSGVWGGNALPVGTRIGEFEIVGLIGIGGFGIVYLAHDHSLGREVALKEYMPSSLAARVEGLTVAVKSARLAETFGVGLRSFVNEARLLARFDHAALVKVYRFWEANGTAYMVMPFYQGVTLRQTLQKKPVAPDEKWLRAVIDPLLDALAVLHRENCFHRDIAPDNILLLADGSPVLLDFGAARRVISDRTQALTVILKPGYAPLEQYADTPHVRQGAWTDIYALSAVVYNAITGRPPTPSVGRSINDSLVPLTKKASGRYSPAFLRAIDRGLAVRPEDRPQTVAEFRALMNENPTATAPDPRAAGRSATPVAAADPLANAVTGAVQEAEQEVVRETVQEAPPARKKTGRQAVYVGVAVVLAALAGATSYLLRERPAPPPAAAPASITRPTAASTVPSGMSSETPASTTTAPAAVQTSDRKSVTEQQLVDMLLGKQGADNARGKAFDPADVLQEIYRQRDPGAVVAVVPEKAKVRIAQDTLRFRINSAKPGYVYILMVGTDKDRFNLLFPNAIDADNGIAGDGELNLPRPGWAMTAGGPAGVDRFVVIVSENRRDFSAAGLRKVDPFAEFPRQVAERIAREAPSAGGSPFAGTVVCPAGQKCSAAYGAALFAIEEIR